MHGSRPQPLRAPFPAWAGVLAACLAVLFTPAASCGEPAAEAEPRPSAPSFTVATFNMNWGNVDLADTVAVIRASGADFVCMQETNPVAEKHLRREFARDYPHMAFRKGERFSSGFGVLSRSELLKVRLLKPKYGYFATLFCVVRLAGRKVLVVSLHLEPIVPGDGEGFAGLLVLMQQTQAIHVKEITRIHSKLPKDAPVVIAGDFNSASYMFAPRFLEAHGFVDSFASVTEKPDSHVTWRWDYGGVDWRFRLDYVFHTKHFVTRASRVVEAISSDHDLVVSRLELTGKDPAPLPEKGERKRRGGDKGLGEKDTPSHR
jgi:endonuclease/exonuclease/phosphatase family metal-dependent hydrolase